MIIIDNNKEIKKLAQDLSDSCAIKINTHYDYGSEYAISRIDYTKTAENIYNLGYRCEEKILKKVAKEILQIFIDAPVSKHPITGTNNFMFGKGFIHELANKYGITIMEKNHDQ